MLRHPARRFLDTLRSSCFVFRSAGEGLYISATPNPKPKTLNPKISPEKSYWYTLYYGSYFGQPLAQVFMYRV